MIEIKNQNFKNFFHHVVKSKNKSLKEFEGIFSIIFSILSACLDNNIAYFMNE